MNGFCGYATSKVLQIAIVGKHFFHSKGLYWAILLQIETIIYFMDNTGHDVSIMRSRDHAMQPVMSEHRPMI